MWDKTVIVGTIKEAAHNGYDQGFREGYEAACLVVEVLAKAEKAGGGFYAASGILEALEMSREKAGALRALKLRPCTCIQPRQRRIRKMAMP